MDKRKMKSIKKISILHEDDAMIASLETGGYQSVAHETEEVQRYTKIFKESGNKVNRVNIRMTSRDIEKAQALALRQGIPYSTFLTSVLHRYLTGRLKEDLQSRDS